MSYRGSGEKGGGEGELRRGTDFAFDGRGVIFHCRQLVGEGKNFITTPIHLPACGRKRGWIRHLQKKITSGPWSCRREGCFSTNHPLCAPHDKEKKKGGGRGLPVRAKERHDLKRKRIVPLIPEKSTPIFRKKEERSREGRGKGRTTLFAHSCERQLDEYDYSFLWGREGDC